MERLPTCTEMTSGGAGNQKMRDGALLGWTGTPRFLVDNASLSGDDFFELVPVIPCYDGTKLVLLWNTNHVAGAAAGTTQTLASVDVTVNCFDPSSGAQSQLTGSYIGGAAQLGFNQNGGINTTSNTYSTFTRAACPNVVSVGFNLWKGFSNTPGATLSPKLGAGVWLANQWRTAAGGWTPATTPADVVGAGFELPISCLVEPEGDDILELIGSVLAEVVAWVPCMVIPVGWDRADRIGTALSGGNVAALSDAYNAAVPGGITCGTVASFEVDAVGAVAIDTCDMDVAPSWVKTAVAGAIVLGIAALAVRRIMWTVGGDR